MSHSNVSGFKSHKLILAATISSLFAIAPSAVFAAEETAESIPEVERISVTGSRIKRIAMEAASPVVSFDAAMMEASGFSTVSDVLRASSLNSFGSFGGGSNNGWSAQANIALKGVGAEKTLVLIDGVRLSKSPITGGSANLNMIPTAAIERIDILTDGASAVYGADAVAGVINIILKKDFEGLEMSAKAERPDSVDGADSEKYTFTGGISSDKGSMVFSWEHYEESALLMSDLPYATAQLKEDGLDAAYLDNWHGISGTGRVIELPGNDWVDQSMNLQNNCDVYNTNGKTEFIGQLGSLSNSDRSVCGYDYTQSAQAMPKQRRDSVLASLNYELTDDITLFARAMWMNAVTDDISAGDPSWFGLINDLPARTITTESGETLDLVAAPGDPSGRGWESWIGYRMNNLGDRHAEHNDNTLSLDMGLEGTIFEDITWDLSANYARYDAFTWGRNYTSPSQLASSVGSLNADGVWEGWDPRDPDSLPSDNVRANFDKKRTTEQTSIRGGFAFDIVELPAGPISAYVGGSHTYESYYSEVDGQAAAGNTNGGNGGSGGVGDRTVDAAYFEMTVPVIKGLEVNLAGRYDDFSDFGGTFNPSVSVAYRPIESLLLRASAGTGFQAPLLTDMYTAGTSGVWSGETDYISCYVQNIQPSDCTFTDEYWVTEGGNPDLNAEESENTNIGLVWQITDNFTTTFDYWTLKTEGLVDTVNPEIIQLMQIALWEEQGMDANISDQLSGVSIEYRGGVPGTDIINITSPFINIGMQEVSGINWDISGTVESSVGDFGVAFNWSHMIEYKKSYVDDEGTVVLGDNQLGEVYYPQDRINTQFSWTMDDHSVTLSSYYISSQENTELDNDGISQVTDSLDDYLFHNLTYNYHTPWNGTVGVGILNLLEDDAPRRTKTPREPESGLYDIRERVFTLSYSQSF